MQQGFEAFWSVPLETLFSQLQAGSQGLTTEAATARLQQYGKNVLVSRQQTGTLRLLLAQFQSPIILILIGAAILSYGLGDRTDTVIILLIVLVSGLLGFWQERGASNAVSKLLAIVETRAEVVRDGASQEIPVEAVVAGDVVVLNAGDSIPGDCRLLDEKDLFVNEAALTGETYPVAKTMDLLTANTPLSDRTNTLFMGTHVVSGTGRAVVVRTGRATEFGKVSERLQFRPPETEFERGIRRFGYLLLEVTLLLVIAIFAGNVFLNRPVLDSFLFALALAVGLTPQLLPAIISVNLAQGAKQMADQQVIVKRLAAIENFGSMNVLCSDKTGTLTEGVVKIHDAVNAAGAHDETILQYAYLNAAYESGFVNPIDAAIRAYRDFDLSAYQKLDEVPYDFIRKRLSILVQSESGALMVTKGALKSVLEVCSQVQTATGTVALSSLRSEIEQRFEAIAAAGFRVLGVATREVNGLTRIEKVDETAMTFLGCLMLGDPPKPDIVQTIEELQRSGVSLKIITGDSRPVATHLANQIGLPVDSVLTGSELSHMSDEALMQRVDRVFVFSEVEPNQKERIILALKKVGNVVGYMGDGINDASALHAADVGISVNTAVDVAKEAADIVLLQQDLAVLNRGVQAGRVTFMNTLKYVFMATSANFGNMFSMAGASLFLPFLPLLPKQILLTNLLTDLPEMTIASDCVDRDLTARPRRWSIAFIRKFMIVFGILSSMFDYLTFGALIFLLKADPAQFRTGWFMESVISASLIVLVIRTRQRFWHSKPGKYLVWTTGAIALITLLLPITPLAPVLGFQPLPPVFLLVLGAIVMVYVASAEITKQFFYQRVKF